MKKKLLSLLLIILFTGYISAEITTTRKKIELKVEKKIDHRSAIVNNPIQASIYNSVVEIHSEYYISNLIISIINTETGEIIYYNQHTDNLFNIDLSEQNIDTEYLILISIEDNLLIKGEFTLN